MTRQEYLARASEYPDDTAHREYCRQFVDHRVRAIVLRGIPLLELTRSTDRSFNDIPLGRWDSLVSMLPGDTDRKLREAGDYLTLGTGVCILKEAARQLVSPLDAPP